MKTREKKQIADLTAGKKKNRTHFSCKNCISVFLLCALFLTFFGGCEVKKETRKTNKRATTELQAETEATVETVPEDAEGEISVDLLTSHWLRQSIQTNMVFRFYADGTFKSFYDSTAFDPEDKTLIQDDTGTYVLDGNNLTFCFDESGNEYTVTYLRKDRHPEIQDWDCADFIPEDEWFFYEASWSRQTDYENAMYFSWAEDDSVYDTCKVFEDFGEAAPAKKETEAAADSKQFNKDAGIYTEFLANKEYLKKSGGDRMTEYCIYDLNQDGTDELILSGVGMGCRVHQIYTYDVQAGVPVFAGEGDSMTYPSYSPSNQTIVTDWRDMNNGNAIYMYSISKLENQSMEYIEFFTYISGENRWTDGMGNTLPAAECEKYMNDTITFEFHPL